MTDLQAQLFSMKDEDYRTFQCRLMPTVPPECVIGVRVPLLRSLAAKLSGTPEAASFLARLPHTYYEENNLHAFLLERIRDMDTAVAEVDRFLPYVDNWATCDSMRPRAFGRHLPETEAAALRWIASTREYTVRFGVEMLMSFFLDDAFRPEHLSVVGALRQEEYYISMMVAWYFATALAKQREATLPWFTGRLLAPQTHHRAVRKALESWRISPEDKQLLRTLLK